MNSYLNWHFKSAAHGNVVALLNLTDTLVIFYNDIFSSYTMDQLGFSSGDGNGHMGLDADKSLFGQFSWGTDST